VQTAVAPGWQRRTDHRRRTIAQLLIVDDEGSVRDSLRRVLERDGHTVRDASGVGAARERLAEETFDLVLCDINMGGESGLDLVREVAADLPDTAVVMVTGVDDPEVAREAIAMGAAGYLLKPFVPNEILINVASGLRRRDLERARRSHLEELEAKILSRGAALQQVFKQLDEVEAGVHLYEQETITHLVTALTLRSEETGSHLQRMSRYAAALAVRRGIEAWSEDEFRVAAMLHDVGKIGVPDSVLLKPGPLNDDEFAAIRRHPDLGAGLIAGSLSRVLQLGARIALTHHERWDGTGYPGGLAGEAIPIEGRIAAVADVFDALTSDRVYRRALPADEAVAMMVEQRGRQFDPELVDLFESSVEDLLAIRAAHADPPPDRLVRVVLADHRRLFSDALTRALVEAGGISVVGMARAATEVEGLVLDRQPDVVVIDADFADIPGLQLAARALSASPGSAVILLAERDDDDSILAALDAGCAGVVRRDRAFDELGRAVGAAHRGDTTVASGRLAAMLTRRSQRPNAGLTPRESDVLALMAEGLSNELIAERLFVSLNTVRNHVQRILTKLSVHSKLEAVAEAGRRGLLPPR
jgi:putative two-component system response regulator